MSAAATSTPDLLFFAAGVELPVSPGPGIGMLGNAAGGGAWIGGAEGGGIVGAASTVGIGCGSAPGRGVPHFRHADSVSVKRVPHSWQNTSSGTGSGFGGAGGGGGGTTGAGGVLTAGNVGITAVACSGNPCADFIAVPHFWHHCSPGFIAFPQTSQNVPPADGMGAAAGGSSFIRTVGANGEG